MSDEPRDQVREALLEHLRRCPLASDTPDGIRRWWLPPALATIEPGVLALVLDELVSEGRLRRRHLPDGGTFYGSLNSTD